MELTGCLILCFSNCKKELMEEYHEEQRDNLIDCHYLRTNQNKMYSSNNS